jgi:DNA-binding MarR family transcriptional regulator
VHATQAGIDLIAGFTDAMVALDDSLLAPLDEDERATLRRLLQKVTAELAPPTR